MKATSNTIIAMLIAIFIISFTLEMSVYIVKYEKFPVLGGATIGFVGFCIDSNPSINYIGDQEAWTNMSYFYDVNVTPYNDSATFYDNTELFNISTQNGTISFIPADNQTGIYYVNISIKNSCNNTVDFEIVEYTVHGPNQAPYFNPPLPANFTMNQSTRLFYDANATDPDNDSITFGEDTNMFEINPYTGIIDFTPVQQDVGNHTVQIWVIDEHMAMSISSVLFIIIDINDPPVMDTIGAKTAFINYTFYYDVNATDVDVKPEWNNITFYDNTSLFDIDASTGVISFKPSDSDNGTYSINISVTDSELWDWEVISFTVTKFNHPPNITDWYPKNYSIEMTEGDLQNFWITKYDPDGTIPSVQWYLNTVPLLGQTNDSYNYYGTPGTHNITVVITDGQLFDSHEWSVKVNPRPAQPPSGGAGQVSAGAPPPCEENWRCAEWPPCPSYGVQIRTCTDINKCGTVVKKPPESQACIYVPQPSCNDKIKNCHDGSCEILIDCGGPCPPCPTCNDKIKNCHKDGSCEEDVDCGGPCPVCKPPEPVIVTCGDGVCSQSELFSCFRDCQGEIIRYLVVGIIMVVICAVLVVKRGAVALRYRRVRRYILYGRKKKQIYTEKQILGLATLRRIYSIRKKLGKEKTKDLFVQFSKAVRLFFAKYFGIKYEFTYVELNEEINKIKLKKSLKESMVNFSIKISEMEYGGADITAADFLAIIKITIPMIEELTGIKLEQAINEEVEIQPEKHEEIPQKPFKPADTGK
jgi:hypothetical protein